MFRDTETSLFFKWLQLKSNYRAQATGAGAVARPLRSLTTLAEDVGSVPCTHIQAQNNLYLQIQGTTSSGLCGMRHVHGTHTWAYVYICIYVWVV